MAERFNGRIDGDLLVREVVVAVMVLMRSKTLVICLSYPIPGKYVIQSW